MMKSLKQKMNVFFSAFCMTVFLSAMSVTPAYAVQVTPGLFEVEGNALVDHGGAGLPDDWERIWDDPAPTPGNGALISLFIGASEEAPGNDVTYFTGGGSTDIHDINDAISGAPNWVWSPGDVAPDKSELTDAFVAAYLDTTNNHTIIYFGVDRYAQAGSAQVGFWFFRDSVTRNDIVEGANTGTFTGNHQERDVASNIKGDLLILSDFTKGGKVSNIRVYEWVGTGPDAPGTDGTLDLIFDETDAKCNGANDDACAIANDGNIDVPWPYTPKSGSSMVVPNGGFFEGGVDLNALLGDDVGCFSSFLAETRSSGSATTAQLKDFALGNFELCGLTITKTAGIGQVCNSESGTQDVPYHYVVDNTGAATLEDMTIVDDNGTPLDESDDLDVIAEDAIPGSTNLASLQTITLAGGAMRSFNVTIPVSGAVTNTVVATGYAGNDEVSDDDDAFVSVQECSITIDKNPDLDDVCEDDSEITYTYVLANTGVVTVRFGGNDVVDDNGTDGTTADDVDLLVENGFITLVSSNPDVYTTYDLLSGTDVTLNYTVTLTDANPGNGMSTNTVTNNVGAMGTADPGGLDFNVMASASAMVDVFICEIDITKDVDSSEVCQQSSGVTYSYLLSNEGGAAVSFGAGDVMDDNGTPSDTGDDVDLLVENSITPPLVLLEGEDQALSYSTSLTGSGTAGDQVDVVNTVTANGTSLNTFPVAEASADRTVTVHDCSISVFKECDDAEGQFGSYGVDISVTNTGTTELTSVIVEDLKLLPTTVFSGTLAVGETQQFFDTLSYLAEGVTPSTNVVTANGTAFSGTDAVYDVAEAEAEDTCIIITNPQLTVEKDCDKVDLVEVSGQPITLKVFYSGSVSNPGNVNLTDVTLVDVTSGGSMDNFIEIRDNNGVLLPDPSLSFSLAIDETYTYKGSYVPTTNDFGDEIPLTARFDDEIQANANGEVYGTPANQQTDAESCDLCPVEPN